MSTKFTKEKASQVKSFARILLDGPSGSGKTWTSLLLAEELGKSTLLFDSENKSSAKYGSDFDFNVVELPDYRLQTYTEALEYAEREPEETTILDSYSHAWVGEGGALEQADLSKSKFGGNKWAAWSEVTPQLNKLTNKILKFPKHLIATARTKTEWSLGEEGSKNGKPTKIGTATIAREGFDYEFDIHMRMDLNHNLYVLKTRYKALDGLQVNRPDKKFAEQVAKAINEGMSQEEYEAKRALSYYNELTREAVELNIKFKKLTEKSKLEVIKTEGRELREKIQAAKQSPPADKKLRGAPVEPESRDEAAKNPVEDIPASLDSQPAASPAPASTNGYAGQLEEWRSKAAEYDPKMGIKRFDGTLAAQLKARRVKHLDQLAADAQAAVVGAMRMVVEGMIQPKK